MDGVDAAPGPRGVGRRTRHVEDEAQGAVAAALDAGAGGLAQDRQVRLEPVGAGRQRPAQSVALSICPTITVAMRRFTRVGS